MNIKTLAISVTIISIFGNLLWILGIIYADINYFLLSMVVIAIDLIIVLKNKNELKDFFNKKDGKVIKDERTFEIDKKASNMAFGITTAINLYLAVILLTLRNIYPQYVFFVYILIGIIIIGFIIFFVGKKYYSTYS